LKIYLLLEELLLVVLSRPEIELSAIELVTLEAFSCIDLSNMFLLLLLLVLSLLYPTTTLLSYMLALLSSGLFGFSSGLYPPTMIAFLLYTSAGSLSFMTGSSSLPWCSISAKGANFALEFFVYFVYL